MRSTLILSILLTPLAYAAVLPEERNIFSGRQATKKDILARANANNNNNNLLVPRGVSRPSASPSVCLAEPVFGVGPQKVDVVTETKLGTLSFEGYYYGVKKESDVNGGECGISQWHWPHSGIMQW